MITWRTCTDRLKGIPVALWLADWLGRGRGRLRWLDGLHVPPAARLRPDLTKWESYDLAAAWIGQATVLLRMGGMTILTDPVFSPRVGIGMGLFTAGPLRLAAPAVGLGELPKIDLVLISHAHFDHLDRPTLARLSRGTQVVTAARTRDLVDDLRFRRVQEVKWGESVKVGGLTISGLEVAHWGARTFYDIHRGYNGYLLEAGGRRVVFAGDTAYQERFRGLGPVELAIFGIAAYDPYIRAHATPEQAWEMAGHFPAKFVLPMHHSTFRLSHEPMDEPMRRMLAAAGGEVGRIVVREIGGMWVGGEKVADY